MNAPHSGIPESASDPTTPEGRAKLRALLAEATPGPFKADTADGVWANVLSLHRIGKDGWMERIASRIDANNARLIAAAVNALPQLLDALDKAEAAIERVRAVIADLDQPTFVSTPDALEELPLLTVVRDRDGEVYERSEWESLTYDHSPCLVWVSPGDPSDQWMYPKLPAQILYTPKETLAKRTYPAHRTRIAKDFDFNGNSVGDIRRALDGEH